ncbi:hypothetical protein [Hoeflea ulvae]|uniref:Uncharacterized protein n=1 Tax=Hoeflea ulvae TaxID=2983764 RepID=A0ABT3YIL4_9HYPH|nr:hypothetical protein [Hoeflea ulvae]MCY0095721.1 hypothetical protein [Hoeflea ulvae]
MIQTTLSVPLEVKPESAARLSALVDEFKYREDKLLPGEGENFERFIKQVPSLHFLSMSVFEDRSYDPIFIIEANFDGEPGVFWQQLEALAGPTIREMLRCCKKPLDEDADLYDAVTRDGSTARVTPYLKARTQAPSVFHHGNRGLTRDQILNEAKLFRAIRSELDAPDHQGPEPYRAVAPKEFHNRLRVRLLADHGWLNEPDAPRIPLSQRLGDLWRLLWFMSLVLLVFTLPGILAASLINHALYLSLVIGFAVILVVFIGVLRTPLPGTSVETAFNLPAFLLRNIPTIVLVLAPPLILLIVAGVGFAAVIDLLFDSFAGGVRDWWWTVALTIFYGQLSLLFTVPAVILWLRYLEKRDSSQTAPPIDAERVAEMADHEDWVSQNHMGSIVHIRPGVLRTIIVKAGHRGLGLLLRVKAGDGYLGSMRTVHFAHWAFLNNSSRLVFFSNFDQSWGSYLDDFIEKAHVGLTLAWGCGVGFPTTRFLIFDGASHGRLFKNWALASRSTSRFWYSAYPDLSVDQVERNHRISNGLRRQDMSEAETRDWMREL